MSHCRVILLMLALACMLLSGPKAFAQDEPQATEKEKPRPAARSIPALNENSGDVQDVNAAQPQLRPDMTPLTGVENATLGTPETRHNYLVPALQYSSQIRSFGTATGTPNTSNWGVDNYVGGGISLLQSWTRSQFAVNYSGGGYFTTRAKYGNDYYQNMQAVQTFEWQKLQLQILDQFIYLPNSQFGFGIGTGLGTAGVGGSLMPIVPGLGGSYVPNQSIYAANGPRYSNAGVIQTTYQWSARTSISAAGSYGLLRFTEPGNVDSDAVIGSLAYNYAITKFDTLGLVYRYSSYHFAGEPQAFGSQVVSLAYGRKLTGRLALQLFAGPSFTTYRVPVNGNTSQVGVDLSANLNVGFENGTLILGYIHGLTAGGGLLTGSTIDETTTTASRRLGHVWTGNVNFGFAHNKPVATTAQTGALSYNSYFVGGGITRPLTRTSDMAFAYSATFNSYDQPGCVGSACPANQTIQYITINLTWRSRTFVLP